MHAYRLYDLDRYHAPEKKVELVHARPLARRVVKFFRQGQFVKQLEIIRGRYRVHCNAFIPYPSPACDNHGEADTRKFDSGFRAVYYGRIAPQHRGIGAYAAFRRYYKDVRGYPRKGLFDLVRNRLARGLNASYFGGMNAYYKIQFRPFREVAYGFKNPLQTF